jgi:UPF0176 protein
MAHLSFYRFLPLANLKHLREELLTFCRGQGLLGTLLLAEEGVNAMVCGTEHSLRAFKEEMEKHFGPGLLFRETPSEPGMEFSRLLVKIKKELVPVGSQDINPAIRTAPRLTPSEFNSWLSQGKNLILLDARNEYEIKVGTFRGAESLGLDCSRDFSRLARERLDSWRGRTIVTFCTGGIRCEKASAVLQEEGLDVWQLEGGILGYFDALGDSPHFEGSCFVFDGRGAVNGKMRPTARGSDPGEEYGRHK